MIAELSESAEGQSPMSNLWTMVTKNHLGSVAAVVVSTLISHGRLTAKDISKKTKFPLKTVKTSLVSLIQLNCVLYWQEGERVDYTFHEQGLLVLLHSGQIINHIRETYDHESAAIIQNLIQIGSIRVEDLVKDADVDTRYSVEIKLAKLFSDGWVKPLQKHDFNPIEDLWNQIYQATMKQLPRSATVSEIKRVAEAKEASRIKLTNLVESLPTGMFDKRDGMKVLKPQTQIAFSYARYQRHTRTNALVSLCESRIGPLTASVYSTALSLIEKSSPEVHHFLTSIDGMILDPEEMVRFETELENRLIDNKAMVFKAHDVVKHLHPQLDLGKSVLTHNFLKPETTRKRVVSFGEMERKLKKPKIKMENLESPLEQEDFADTVRSETASLVNHHLKLLSSSSAIPFIVELSPGTFTVPFHKLKQIVLEYNYDEVMKKTVGSDGLRILRCIKQMKLVDEKTVAHSVLLKDKLVRNEIYKLVQLNVIEIQEVPRSNDRAASKTFYAYRYKQHTSFNFFKNTLVYNMANILHLIDQFKGEHKVLLDKCEREDVKGHEAELLLDSELRTLKGLKFREINNMGKLHRLLAMYEIFSRW
ncbi:RNA polymerase III subunit C82 [Yamadazyma tenuis]|uniref:DNA-directed RNA polymerase III subunit RPC3 n=1 Tax=Candida tenuis (strain ATCC 10573 / BCRC 21748 / CBS 615 / JCM 9827 / NBRC 10315 / NRRL Y-1498 / VKM Y-70) TaxID=590646 RepID=G3AZV9_CANTC|nr:uncharacterized protein CANTEDRAFT_102848 [Yamadazyma tenuis ATCC 10573]EGV65251.1 hypothetical protein CANTEDRAFT_102848 [Yamadazyma tenuis ATCC 10573]WEJ95093.1 RNA polymerase III subunit C82 [Yamadazyma tenuis]